MGNNNSEKIGRKAKKIKRKVWKMEAKSVKMAKKKGLQSLFGSDKGKGESGRRRVI